MDPFGPFIFSQTTDKIKMYLDLIGNTNKKILITHTHRPLRKRKGRLVDHKYASISLSSYRREYGLFINCVCFLEYYRT